MKNIILSIIFPVFVFALVFNYYSVSRAESLPTETELYDYIKEQAQYDISDVTSSVYSNYCTIPNSKLVVKSSGSEQCEIFFGANLYLSSGKWYTGSNCYYYRFSGSNYLMQSVYATTYNNMAINYSGTVLEMDSIYDAASPVDYENPVYSSAIPVPNMVVTCTNIPLAYGSTSQVYTRCDINENDAFYIQLQAKFSVADTVKIGLNDGVYTYEYLTWYNSDSYDIYSLGSDANEIHVTATDFNSIWSAIISNFSPEFTTSVPFWLSNPNAQKYLDAQSNYTNKLMLQAPLFGSRMELFARYYAVVEDVCYVGKWVHWNSANPSNTEELSNQYQVDQPFPGYQNDSTNENLPNEDNTYTTIGDNTSVNNDPYTNVIINNNVPNYPDYPTAVSYNHDNILLQFITTAKQLPNFFGDVGSFLTASFTFIPSSIWALIGFGFMCSIVVMIIKVL